MSFYDKAQQIAGASVGSGAYMGASAGAANPNNGRSDTLAVALENCIMAAKQLSEMVTSMEQRLSPLMRNEVTETSAGLPGVPPTSTPLTTAIQNHHVALATLVCRLQSIDRRLDL